MKSIYKYEIQSSPTPFPLSIPRDATVLSAGVQGDLIYIWVEIDTDECAFENRYFEVFGTGHKIHCDMGVERKFIQTVFMEWMVFHVYERIS